MNELGLLYGVFFKKLIIIKISQISKSVPGPTCTAYEFRIFDTLQVHVTYYKLISLDLTSANPSTEAAGGAEGRAPDLEEGN